MIERNRDETNIKTFIKKANTSFSIGDVVTTDEDGYVVKATTDTPSEEIVGLIQQDVTTTSAEYGKNTPVAVDVPRDTDEFSFDVKTGTASQSTVGQLVDLEDAKSVNLNKSDQGHVRVTRFISDKEVVGYLQP